MDWDRIRLGSLAAEVVRTTTLVFGYDLTPELRALDLERVAAFTVGYREAASLADASCDHLFVWASVLLSCWSEHRDSVFSACTTA